MGDGGWRAGSCGLNWVYFSKEKKDVTFSPLNSFVLFLICPFIYLFIFCGYNPIPIPYKFWNVKTVATKKKPQKEEKCWSHKTPLSSTPSHLISFT